MLTSEAISFASYVFVCMSTTILFFPHHMSNIMWKSLIRWTICFKCKTIFLNSIESWLCNMSTFYPEIVECLAMQFNPNKRLFCNSGNLLPFQEFLLFFCTTQHTHTFSHTKYFPNAPCHVPFLSVLSSFFLSLYLSLFLFFWVFVLSYLLPLPSPSPTSPMEVRMDVKFWWTTCGDQMHHMHQKHILVMLFCTEKRRKNYWKFITQISIFIL